MLRFSSPRWFNARLLFVALALFALAGSASAQTATFGPPLSVFSFSNTNNAAAAPGALGDFNNDGKLDVVVVKTFTILQPSQQQTRLVVLFGNGAGGIQSSIELQPAGARDTYSVKAGDVNNDGKLDLVTANNNSQNFTVVLGNGNGTFGATANYPIPLGAAGGRGVALGDLNGDGWLDLIGGDSSFYVHVYVNNQNGTFGAGASYTDIVSFQPNRQDIAVADLDGDGNNDLVVGNRDSGGSLSVFLGNGNGTLTASANYPGAGGRYLVVSDFNGDGVPDVASETANSAAVFLGSASPTYALGAPTYFPTGSGSTGSLAAADFNGDGKLDLALSNGVSHTDAVLLGDGLGSFSAPNLVPDPLTAAFLDPRQVMAGDMNGDGRPDLVTLNKGSGPQSPYASVMLNTSPVVDPDTDDDGVPDDEDAFPNDASETLDTDGDGIGDNSDPYPNFVGTPLTQTLTILGGVGNVGDVAPNVEYYNPATGDWQPAYLADKRPGNPGVEHDWGVITGTNHWINYKSNGSLYSDPGVGTTVATAWWYLYRVRFTVPADAQNATMTFSLKADNLAQVAINGVSTGPTIEGQANQLNADAVFSQNVHPGENTITINVGDYGGLNGFNFRIDLSVQSAEPLEIVPTAPADTDGDGTPDAEDAFPNDPNETTDTDEDGTGDNADAFDNDATETTDTDGDGTGDNADAFDNDASETTDTDGDGTGDNADAFDNDATETTDSDGDGTGDNADAFDNDATETTDSDGDGVGNNGDAFPNNPAETTDSDGDGVGNNGDAFPNNPAETTDSDGDGVGNNGDAFPNNPAEHLDSDGDGFGDNGDAFPNNPAEHLDSDGDGFGDNGDAFPNNPAEHLDSDGDGVGNNGDLYPLNPLVWSNQPPVAANDAYAGQWNTALTVAAPGVKDNDSDLGDGVASLTASKVTNPSHGTVSFNADGSFTYLPVGNYSGTDSFTYRLTDPFGVTSNNATVVITIATPCPPKSKKGHKHHYKGDGDDHDKGRNGHRKGDRCEHDRDGDGHGHDDDDNDDDDDVVCAAGTPKTNKDNYSMKQGTALTVSARSGVRRNDGKTPATIELWSNPSRGTLTLVADGSFVYTPATGFTGTDTFFYVARSTSGIASHTERVTIQVTRRRGNDDDCSNSSHDHDHDRDKDWSHKGKKYQGSSKHDHDDNDHDR